MFHRIHHILTELLLEMPETGLGYQVVQASTFKSELVKPYIVYNAQLFLDLDSEFNQFAQQFLDNNIEDIQEMSKLLELNPKTIRMIPKSTLYTQRHNGLKAATESSKQEADSEVIFVRMTPYFDDLRLCHSDKKLRPGSYVTSVDDYGHCVYTDDNPVDRYALPYSGMLESVSYLQVSKNEQFQKGIVQPLFNQNGGGEEIFLELGTSKNSYISTKKYGS